MAVTTEHYYTGNASTTSFAYTFPYYKTADIKVTWDGVLKTESTHYNVTGTNIVFTSGNTPANNVVIRIYRDTDVDTSKATFAAGSSIRATDLNNNELQLLYHAQEQQSSGRVNTNISAKAEIDVSKLKDGTARQLIQTDAAGTGVEWTSNIDVPGTLDVTGATTLDSNLGVTGNITVSGTVDGRDVSTDGTKLDGIEAGAKGDQTAAEIKSAYEGVSNTNAYTDAEKTKLAAIEASADVTDATNVNAAGAVMNSDLDGKGEILIGDGSGDPTALAVGTNDYVLTAASGEATGVKWAAAAGGGGGSDITVQEEGSSLSTAATTLNFVGSNVTASGTGATKTITVSGGSEITVQEEGSSLSTAATTLNFVGSNVTASGTGTTKTITVTGGAANATDFKYLELKAHNNASGAFSAGSADYELVTAGTTTAISPDAANALLISVAGVIQKPNTGTSIGSNDGFCIDGSSIHFGANLAAHPDFIIYLSGGIIATVSDDAITNAKILDDTIAEAKLDIHAAPSGTDKFLKYTSNGMEWVVPSYTTNTDTVYTHPNHSGEVTSTADGDTVIVDDIVYEANLKISNAGSNGQFLSKQSGNTGGLTWASVTSTPEGTAILSTGETGGTKFLREDGDNSCSWQSVPAGVTQENVEDWVGGMVTGNTETGITVTYEDGDGTLDFVVGTLNQDTTGTAAIATTVTVADESSDTTCYPLFTTGDTGDLAPKSGSNLTFNSATGALGATSYTGDGSALTGVAAASADGCMNKNTLTISNAHTIASTEGAHSVGPITLSNTVTVNGRWVIS